MYKDICDSVYQLLNNYNNNKYKLYNYDKGTFEEGVPAITIAPGTGTYSIADNVSYQVDVPILVRIYVNSEKITEVNEGKFRNLADGIIEQLYKDYQLNGKTLRNKLDVSFGYTSELKYRICEINVVYTKLLSL